MASGDFRSDFYYRINVTSSPFLLRDRKRTSPFWRPIFWEKYSRETKKTVDGISPAGVSLLVQYDWPGNVRELENAIERAGAFRTRNLTLRILHFAGGGSDSRILRPLRSVEQSHIRRVLKNANGNVTQAARILVNRSNPAQEDQTIRTE
ncbi:MAG: helix-turn-helix domain-containing protein [Desulfobacterales bacterium]